MPFKKNEFGTINNMITRVSHQLKQYTYIRHTIKSNQDSTLGSIDISKQIKNPKSLLAYVLALPLRVSYSINRKAPAIIGLDMHTLDTYILVCPR